MGSNESAGEAEVSATAFVSTLSGASGFFFGVPHESRAARKMKSMKYPAKAESIKGECADAFMMDFISIVFINKGKQNSGK